LLTACAAPEAPAPSLEIFRDATAETGLDFVHFNGMSGERYIIEIFGPGGALFDYDNDGDLDLWIRQGVMIGPGKELGDATFPPADPDGPWDRLFRNDLEQGSLRFTDVTEQTGLRVADYGMGIATGDYDNDGRIDLYLTNFGPNRLLRNNGDGSFSDTTAASGAGDDRWSVPAVFADFDRDGWLDLWVGNYVDFGYTNRQLCRRPNSALDYCGPLSFEPQPDRLLRNRGDGSFEDVTTPSGLASAFGNALGVLAVDLDEDGLLDLYVANDANDNLLWINRGGLRFEEEGMIRGCAVNHRGEREGSMGITAGDFDADGDLDLFTTHIAVETNTLYVNDGAGNFSDDTLVAGLATPSRRFTGFGTGWLDYDNDGWLDLLAVNGEVKVIDELELAGDPYPLDQADQLFRNRGDGSFEDVSAAAGPALAALGVSRGAAFGDLDNDGDTDVVVLNNSGPARLLLNEVGNGHHWLGVDLRERSGRAVTHGARVALLREGGPALLRHVGTDGSYVSANDRRVLFGLGADPSIEALQVVWPSGTVERYPAPEIDRYVEIVEGRGQVVDAD
jgi:hypothetical protein